MFVCVEWFQLRRKYIVCTHSTKCTYMGTHDLATHSSNHSPLSCIHILYYFYVANLKNSKFMAKL